MSKRDIVRRQLCRGVSANQGTETCTRVVAPWVQYRFAFRTGNVLAKLGQAFQVSVGIRPFLWNLTDLFNLSGWQYNANSSSCRELPLLSVHTARLLQGACTNPILLFHLQSTLHAISSHFSRWRNIGYLWKFKIT